MLSRDSFDQLHQVAAAYSRIIKLNYNNLLFEISTTYPSSAVR